MDDIEKTHIETVSNLWPESGESGDVSRSLRALDDALAACPRSARLWSMRGDLLQLSDEPLDEAILAYQKAIENEPDHIDALEGLAYLFDAVLDQPERAVPLFERAVSLGAGTDSLLGLARSLAQIGETERALAILDSEHRDPSEKVKRLRKEIQSGLWS